MDKYTTAIDSFKLFIDLSKVEVVSKLLGANIIRHSISADTGEVLDSETLKSNSYKHQKFLYQIHYGIVLWFDATAKQLVILINSKLLETKYREGINKDNIRQIYEAIQADNVVKFASFESFMNDCRCTDIDIKKDIQVDSTETFDKITDELNKLTIPTTKKGHGSNRFNRWDNKGIEWNERKSSTKARPFLKIYHKGIESKNSKNKDFFSHYLGDNSMCNTARIETTIRSKKDLKAYGILDNTLKTIMDIPQSQLDEIINDSLTRNTQVSVRPKQIRVKEGLKPLDAETISYLVTLIEELNMSFERALSYILGTHTDTQVIRRRKEAITDLYNQNIAHLKLDTNAQVLDKFLSKLGI